MKAKKQKAKKPLILRILGGFLATLGTILLVLILIAANTLLPHYGRMLNDMMTNDQKVRNRIDADTAYTTPDYTAKKIGAAAQQVNEEVEGEGAILLKNDDHTLPFAKGTKFSFFSHSSVDVLTGTLGLGGGTSLKTAFENDGFEVNDQLWDFYTKGAGKDYKRGAGSINYGRAEDFRLNECPIDVITSDQKLTDSFQGTTAVFVWSRVVGEGRDMPRSMVNHTDIAEDKVKSYLEPDSVELGILSYLNDHFDNVVLLINSPAAMELGWVNDYENIHAVLYMGLPGSCGLNSIARIFSGEINPSGHTVDTYAYDAFSAPAAENYGDYQYYDESSAPTRYNYLSYDEGIYVGYRYYETRYEDAILEQNHAGDYDYDKTVQYPFGYGLSYTDFAWSDFQSAWNGDTCTVTVNVTNTGKTAGKDVVEVYAQSPYTDYDKANGVEKPSVQLVGFAKTDLLDPGAAQAVTVTFSKDQLKAYDANGAKTYIFDAGDYYVTAGTDAHNAVQNILAAKGHPDGDHGDAAMAARWNPHLADTDVTTYAADSATGTQITNEFDTASAGLSLLSRSDWEGTYPEHDGTVMSDPSTWGNEINGKDAQGNPASFVYGKTISAEDLAKLDSTDSLNPEDPGSFQDKIVLGEQNGMGLIDMRGLSFDDPAWETYLNELTAEDYHTLITSSGYGTPTLKDIGKPYALDADAANGLVFGGNGVTFSGCEVLAMTWNKELAQKTGNIIGNTGLLSGVDGWYSPSMNIHRTPFGGRNNEYFSEDPFMTGAMASEEIRAVSAKGMYVYAKHFALNDQENHRGDTETEWGAATFAPEQAIREIYLRPFEQCVKCGTTTIQYLQKGQDGSFTTAEAEVPACNGIMTSFNRLGYTWTGGNYYLIQKVLRDEWGFNGFVITDADTPTHMDVLQMVFAGADAKLNYMQSYDFDVTASAANYHYGRQAAHHILYTIANSSAMNGIAPGAEMVGITAAGKLRIGLTMASAAVLALEIFCLIRKIRRRHEAKAEVTTE